MSKIDFYLFRHGETDWNAQRRFQGHTDIELNENGRGQARGLAEKLKWIKLDAIVCSDLKRAQETAKIVNRQDVPVFITDQIRETFIGEPEGMILDDIIKKYGPESWQKWLSIKKEDLNYAFPQGETKLAQLTRTKNYLENFAKKNPHMKTLGVSTHGGTLSRLLHHSEGSPQELVPLKNCCLILLHYHLDKEVWTFSGEV